MSLAACSGPAKEPPWSCARLASPAGALALLQLLGPQAREGAAQGTRLTQSKSQGAEDSWWLSRQLG